MLQKEAQDITVNGYLAGYMNKEAGTKSEMLAGLNPLNLVGSPLGLLASTLTPTRTKEEQDEADEDKWTNALIPGWAGYNMGKRIGRIDNSKESDAGFYQGGAAAWKDLPYSDWLIKQRIKAISGADYPQKKLDERAKAIYAIVAARQESKPSFSESIGAGLLGGPFAMAGLMQHEFPQQWGKDNPKQAAKLKKLMLQDMGPKYKARWEQKAD